MKLRHMAWALLLSLSLTACEEDSDTPIDTIDMSADMATDMTDMSTSDIETDTTPDLPTQDTEPEEDLLPQPEPPPLPNIAPTEAFDAIEPAQDGPWKASYSLRSVVVGQRTLAVGVWAPTATEPTPVTLTQLLADDRAEAMNTLLAAAPATCPTQELEVALDAEIADGAWPLVLYSHCHECLGISGATVARRLATWGHIVIAPDHTGNTLWDAQEGTGVQLGAAFLEVRGADMQGLLDAVEQSSPPFEDLTAHLDLERVGIAGHSFGAVTAGWVAQRDPRIDALLAIAAPIENLLLPGVEASEVYVPTVMMVAVEDNSILEIGNNFLRDNFEEVPGVAFKVEVADAGHWSVSDLCGLVDAFAPGCGEGVRQTNREAFTYLDPDQGRALTATWATALFGAALHADPKALQWLQEANDDDQSTVERRNQ